MQLSRRFSSFVSLALLVTTPTMAEVLTVGPEAGTDFSDLQVAIDAAQDGDTLRLSASAIFDFSGAPFVFNIGNKDLRLVGETPAPKLWAGITITGLAAGKSIVLSNINFDYEPLRILGCLGSVRVQDTTVIMSAEVKNSSDVVFTRSTMYGWSPSNSASPDDGLLVDGSSVAVFSCEINGGHADQHPAILSGPAPDGAHGCHVVNGGFVYLADSTLRGGDGGNGHIADFLDPPVDAGDGGHGLAISHGDAVVFDCARVGGDGGDGSVCAQQFPNCGTPGADGVAGQGTYIDPGPDPTSLDEILGNARTAEVVTWVEDTNEVTVNFHGEQHDLIFFPGQATGGFLYDPIWKGVWAQPSSAVQPVGTIPASGSIMLTLKLPPAVTCEAATHFLQAAFLQPLPQAQFDRFVATPVALVSFSPPADYPTTCSVNPNSTGLAGLVAGSGNPDVTAGDLSLSVVQLPLNKFGYFLMSQTQTFIPLFAGSQGNLCVGPSLIRFAGNVLNSGATGTVAFQPNFASLPSSTVFTAGDTWYFQYWYRDNIPASTSNTSAALVVSFCP
jgi:hypothetical protein